MQASNTGPTDAVTNANLKAAMEQRQQDARREDRAAAGQHAGRGQRRI